MPDSVISRGFSGKRRAPESAERVPPGQYVTYDFPVFSAGPTPRSPLADWTFRVEGLVGEPVSWTWDEFLRLLVQSYVADIHCVTKWSKLDTRWEGVGVDRLLESVANTLAELGIRSERIRTERFGPTGATG
jgi:DMSO/TMAO reductase YedYZ molybdopterin-dependent catalytic subunit